MLPKVRVTGKSFLPGFLLFLLIVLLNSASVNAQIVIPATATSIGRANPYPAVFNVSGQTGVITKVTVSLNGFSHAFPDDVDIMLVSPDGRNAIILSDVGGDNRFPLNNVNLVLDDAAAASLPDETQITSGTYKPTNAEPGDTFPPATGGNPSPPSTSANTALSTFNGIDPNGEWRLYVADDAVGDDGSIASYSLTFTTGAPPTAAFANLSGRVTTASGGAISGARVTVLDTTTQESHIVVTDASGNFNVPSLQVGNYYLITVNQKRYSFAGNVQGIQFNGDEVLNFTGHPSKARVRIF